ncbi:MAG TPA: toll/interleukin-1 receptor domain-containing protein [Pyrinomonadaceae bacterium]|jgi:tetratricopeptide (TPR) repeat protein
MSDVFISYAREDRDKAEGLARVCEQQKWTVWWDKVIPPGKKYADVIGQELASAKAVVVLWSRASVASDWVKDEAQEAANRGILFPALLEKVNPPYGFRQVQTADLSEWDSSSTSTELESFVRAIGGVLNKPVNDSALSSDHTDLRNRRTLLYLVAGVLIVLIVGFAAYRFLFDGGGHRNQNQIASGNRESLNENRTSGQAQICNSESRHSAADLTGKGLMMIDPGGNQAAAVLQFNEAISECPEYADAYFWRAQSFVALQQNQKAVADFKKVVEITTDADTRQKAEKFIADIENPRPTPTTPVSENTNKTNTNGSNVNSSNTGGSNVKQVNEMFEPDRSTRIAATTRLIIDRKNDSATVQLSVRAALANPQNKSGVINTLVYLENVSPALLKQNKSEIEKLLAAAKDNGPQTADHIKKVQDLLNN